MILNLLIYRPPLVRQMTSSALTLLTTRRLEEHATGVIYSHNGLYIAYSDNSKALPEVAIINFHLAETVICQPSWGPIGLGEIAQIQWSPDDNFIIIYDCNYFAYVHDTQTGAQIGDPIIGVPYGHNLSWNLHGNAVCYAGSGQQNRANCVIIRKLRTGEDIITTCGKPNDRIMNVTWSPDGTQICTLIRYGQASKSKIQLWRVSV